MYPALPPAPSISPFLTGPPLVGVVLSWWLYGILTMQYFMYMNSSNKGRKWLQVIVHLIFLMDTVQAFMSLHDLFYWFVYRYNDPSELRNLHLSSITAPFLDAIIAFTVQLVYSWRIWVLGQWKILPAIIVILSFLNCGVGIFLGVHGVITGTVESVDGVLATAWSSLTAITDIMIAVCMTYLLLKYRSVKPSQRTIALIQRIMLLTLETNALTTVNAIILVFFFVIPSVKPEKTNLFATVGYVIGKIYSNSFMVLLNQRIYYKASRRADPSEVQLGVLASTTATQDNSGTIPSGRHPSSQDWGTGLVSTLRFADPAQDEIVGGTGERNSQDTEPLTDDNIRHIS